MKTIDWDKYNEPPYLPQWLCEGETLELARFDDPLRKNIERQVHLMVEQYDLDNIEGEQLDRIGNLLSEPRLGNDDDLYRIHLKLRILLNTTNGSINDIIKVVKFFFSSEIVHIVPNYPAGLSILRDGEGPPIDFNRIIAAVVPAGVSYDTRELYDFIENLVITETHEMEVSRVDSDSVTQTILRNGRVLRDGATVFDTQLEPLYRDGTAARDGSIIRNGSRRVTAIGTIYPPFYRQSGPHDEFELSLSDGNYIDGHKSLVYRNSAFLRDAAIDRSGFAPYSINDTMDSSIKLALFFEDTIAVSDRHVINVSYDAEETIARNMLRNGRYSRDGSIYRSSDGIIDPFHAEMGRIEDIDSIEAQDEFLPGIIHHYYRDSTRLRDGSIEYKGGIFIPLE